MACYVNAVRMKKTNERLILFCMTQIQFNCLNRYVDAHLVKDFLTE